MHPWLPTASHAPLGPLVTWRISNVRSGCRTTPAPGQGRSVACLHNFIGRHYSGRDHQPAIGCTPW